MNLLTVNGLGKEFGGLKAVDDLSFSVAQGEILAVIGPNGAGKTTTLNLLSGLLLPTSGRIEMHGTDMTDFDPDRRCHLGLGRAFQVVQPFPEMTVEENVKVGALFGSTGIGQDEAEAISRRSLERTGLWSVREAPAEELTLMQEKRLEIARALATGPSVLLLDEVMAGLRPVEAKEAVKLVKQIRDDGIAIIFIEHVMPVVRDLADRVIVMDYGRKIAEGSYSEVTSEPAVIEAYLGSEVEDVGNDVEEAP